MKHLQAVLTKAIRKAYPLPDFIAEVKRTTTGSSDFCSASAMKIFNTYSKKEGWSILSSKEVAEEIIKAVEKDELIEDIKVTHQVVSGKVPKVTSEEGKPEKKQKQIPDLCFIDIIISPKWLENTCMSVLKNGIHVKSNYTDKKILVDFSSPNIAKEMHVGHLRGTIIGDTICRILEYLGNDVKRINHIGDWGTPFGMIIAILKEEMPNILNEKPEIKDLEGYYIKAKKLAKEDEEFKKKAKECTVKLQQGDKECLEMWHFVCDITLKENNKLYQMLGVKLEDMGESFYDPIWRQLEPELEKKGHIVQKDGAKVINIPGKEDPFILVKSDGGLTYCSSDMAALYYRVNKMDRDWVIYCIGNEQENHLNSLFEAGKICGFYDPSLVRVDHMGYGLILGSDKKKISTRTPTGEPVKLMNLLEKAKLKAKDELVARNEKQEIKLSKEELETASAKIGYSAVKYYDLKQSRNTEYQLDYKKMLDYTGNTAVYLFYSYVRMLSIYKKAGIDEKVINKLLETDEVKISDPKEKELLLHLLRFNDVLDEVVEELAIHKLTDYLYGIAVRYSEFFENCMIIGNNSRILIVELTRRFMKLCFDLLGMTPVDRI
jgi:arginyl-tRNA synthetase